MTRGIADYFKSKSLALGFALPGIRALARRLAAASSFAAAMLSAFGATPSTQGVMPGLLSHPAWPLFFEPGYLQSNGPINFIARGPNYQLVLAPAEVNFILRKPELSPAPGSVRRDEALALRSAPARVVRIAFEGADLQADISGADQMEGAINYLVGDSPSQWRTQVPMFARIKVAALYPGIELVYYRNHQQLEYDFNVAPETDPSVIRLHFDGVDKLSVSSEGELVVSLGDAELRQHAPVAYQTVRGVRREVAARYEMNDSHTVSFALGTFDHGYPLVIDPVFSYATYFGGNGGDTGLGIKVDNNGSVYIAGETLSTQFPWVVPGTPFQSGFHGGTVTGDAFVAKLDNTGSRLLYFTYLGGSSDDGAYDLAIDADGNAYITGFTASPNFPTKNALFNKISGSKDPTINLYPSDVFVAELNTNGSALIFSTYLGGTDRDVGSGIAVDPAGYTYVTGYTYSTNFPVRNAFQAFSGGTADAFVAKLAPGGSNLVYATYLGGNANDQGSGIAADSGGFAYVTGYTDSTNFPVAGSVLGTNLNGSGSAVSGFDAFVTRIAPNGQNLAYSTYLGGSSSDYGYRIALDSSGGAYVTGATQSTNFPHASVLQMTFGENGSNSVNFDAFLTKLGSNGAIAYSAQFGGTANDSGWDVAVDPLGRAFVIGITQSTDFPVVSPFGLFRSTNSGVADIFVVAFNTNGTAVHYSGYLGGSANDYGYAIAVDADSNAYLSGMTLSSGFPIAAGAFQSALDGKNDSFVAKIRLFDPVLNVVVVGGTTVLTWSATAPDFLLQSTFDLAPPQVWTTVSQPLVVTNGQYLVTLSTTNTSELFRLQGP